MDKYIEAEKKLAELLGWAKVEYLEEHRFMRGRPPNVIEHRPVPRWTNDWASCGPLLGKYELYVMAFPPRIEVGDYVDMGDDGGGFCSLHYEPVADHPNIDIATMFAIVQAVIHKLEGELKCQ